MRFIFLFLFLFFKKGFWKLPRDTSSYISSAKILPQIHVQLEKSVRNAPPRGAMHPVPAAAMLHWTGALDPENAQGSLPRVLASFSF